MFQKSACILPNSASPLCTPNLSRHTPLKTSCNDTSSSCCHLLSTSCILDTVLSTCVPCWAEYTGMERWSNLPKVTQEVAEPQLDFNWPSKLVLQLFLRLWISSPVFLIWTCVPWVQGPPLFLSVSPGLVWPLAHGKVLVTELLLCGQLQSAALDRGNEWICKYLPLLNLGEKRPCCLFSLFASLVFFPICLCDFPTGTRRISTREK